MAMMSEMLRKNPAENVAKGKGALNMNLNLKWARDAANDDACGLFIK
jgi:hypothetical protein